LTDNQVQPITTSPLRYRESNPEQIWMIPMKHLRQSKVLSQA